METAVIYARYSCENQTEQSIEGQLHVCEDYAKSKGILILNTYIDRAMTGTNDNRPDFQRMLKDCQKREWNYVIVYKLDRFSRNKYEMAMHKRTLKDHGVKLISATEYIPDTPEAIIIESMLEGYAEYYSAELSQKVRRGMRESRLKGNFSGGVIIYGYRVENHKVVVVEEEADVIRLIFSRYAMGVYVKDIMDELNSLHITNRGKPFARNTIYNLLKNEKYVGIFRHNDEVFDNIYPQIVPNEIFEIVRGKTMQNKKGSRSVQYTYLMRNKLICGYCGSSITGECGTARNGERIRYYKCIGRRHHNGCKKQNIHKERFEEIIVNSIIEALSTPAVMDRMVYHILEEQERNYKRNTKLVAMQKEKRQVDTALENVMKAVELGVVNQTTQRRMRELETQQQELEKQIIIEQSKVVQKLDERDIREFYVKALALEPKMLIDYLIEKVVLFDDKVEIHFKRPSHYNLEAEGGFCFCKAGTHHIHYFNATIRVYLLV